MPPTARRSPARLVGRAALHVLALAACGGSDAASDPRAGDGAGGAGGATTSTTTSTTTTGTTAASTTGAGGAGGATTSAGGASAGGGHAGGAAATETTLEEPVYAKSLADPFLLRAGATWHAYGTSAGGHHIPHLTSTDLQHWKASGDALPAVDASWVDAADPQTWAPGVVALGPSRFVLYFAAHVLGTAKRHCVGRAVAKTPDGPFVDDFGGPLVCVGDTAWSLDPSPFVDADGTLTLLWRQDEGGDSHVAARALGPLGEHFAAGSTTTLVLAHTAGSWEDNASPALAHLIENPALVRRGAGEYVLFYSGNSWQTADYATGYATCSSPLGPCTKATTKAPWLSKSAPKAAWLDTGGEMLGPGGLDLFVGPGGERWVAWHAWTDVVSGPAATRSLFLGRLAFGANGAPTLEAPKVAW